MFTNMVVSAVAREKESMTKLEKIKYFKGGYHPAPREQNST